MQKYMALLVHKHLEESFQLVITLGRFMFAALFLAI